MWEQNDLMADDWITALLALQADPDSNLENLETMKISTKPVSSRTPEKNDCSLVRSSNPGQSSENVVDHADDKDDGGKLKTPARPESKVPAPSTRADVKDGEIARLCRSKKVSCQDTIHEYDEDDNLTMDRVGR